MSYSYDDVYVLHAWRDNRRRLVLTQGEGYSGTITDNDVIKAPRFQLRDERDVIEIPSSGSPSVQLAVTRSNHTEDLLTCTVVDRENGIISCPITKSLTDVAGEVKGEIRLVTANSVTKFYGVDFYIFDGVSDASAAQSSQFSALIEALQQVGLVISGGSSGTVALDTVIQHNGTKPVASGILYDYLIGDYKTYLDARFVKYKYAHTTHSSVYDAETNPIDNYGDTTFEGVYIDEATELGVCYIIKNENGARVGLLFCASVPSNSNASITQIALYYNGGFKYRYKHSSGGAWDNWTNIELQQRKDLYNSEDITYFGISNDDSKYPSSKALYKFIQTAAEVQSNRDLYDSSDTTYFGITNSDSKHPSSKAIYKYIQANAQAIVDIYKAISDSVLLGYDTLTIDKEYNIHKDVVETYLNDSDYSADTGYTISKLDNFDFGYETHGRPNKTTITIPTGGVAIKYKDTVTGREWTEPTESTTYIQNLIPNHIYIYQILDSNNAVLKTGTAKASGKVRMISAGGDTYNIRDIGGWDANGGTLKYGVVYRGAELNGGISITSDQQAFFRNALGIRDEIDVRDSNANTGSTSLGVGVDYLHQEIKYAPTAFAESHYKDIATVIKRIAQDVNNSKAVYIHCQAGADRTGFVCLCLEAICGVSQNDIDRDYELTSFSKEPGSNNNWTYRISRKRNSAASYHLKAMVTTFEAMEGNDFNDKVVRFLLRTGVTIDEINAIRFGLIDGNPSKLDNPYGTVTVTSTLSNVVIDNPATTITKYQPYEATLTVEDLHKITSLSITMGGVDASSYYSNGKLYIPIVTGNIVITATGTLLDNQIVVFSHTLTSSGWNSNNEQTITLPSSYTVTSDVIADTEIDSTAYNQLCADGCGGIYISSERSGSTLTLTAHALNNKPTANVTIQVTLTKVSDLSE